MLIVLQEKPNFQFWVSEVVTEIRERGSICNKSDNPANALRTSLERLVERPDSDVFKTRWHDGPSPTRAGRTARPELRAASTRGTPTYECSDEHVHGRSAATEKKRTEPF